MMVSGVPRWAWDRLLRRVDTQAIAVVIARLKDSDESIKRAALDALVMLPVRSDVHAIASARVRLDVSPAC